MSNMTYCQFQNTLADLRQCYEAMDDKLSEEEERARQRLISLCERIGNEYGSECK